MNMKLRKIISILGIGAVCILSWLILFKGGPITVANTVNYRQYGSVDELFKNAALVVVGNTTQSLRDSKTIEATTENGLEGPAFSITDFQIKKIIKGDTEKLNIKVQQDAWFLKGKCYVMEGYTPLVEKKEYMLFLLKNLDGQGYAIMGVNQGKFNIDGMDKDEEKQGNKDEHYSKLKKEVLEKFIKNHMEGETS